MTKPAWAPTAERLNDAVNRLVAASQPLKVILFGSHARGEADDHSDVDLLIIDLPPFNGTTSGERIWGRMLRKPRRKKRHGHPRISDFHEVLLIDQSRSRTLSRRA